MIEPVVAAYAAGVIDGDGCIQVNKRYRLDWIYYSITVSVSQVSEDIPNWFLRNFGGRVNKFFSSKERRQPVYRWSADCKQAAYVLQLVLPFLIQKQERAKLAIQLQDSMVPKYSKIGAKLFRKKPSEEVMNNRLGIFNRMKELNKQYGRNHWLSPKGV